MKLSVLPVNQLTEGLTKHERGGQFGTNPYAIHFFFIASQRSQLFIINLAVL